MADTNKKNTSSTSSDLPKEEVEKVQADRASDIGIQYDDSELREALADLEKVSRDPVVPEKRHPDGADLKQES